VGYACVFVYDVGLYIIHMDLFMHACLFMHLCLYIMHVCLYTHMSFFLSFFLSLSLCLWAVRMARFLTVYTEAAPGWTLQERADRYQAGVLVRAPLWRVRACACCLYRRCACPHPPPQTHTYMYTHKHTHARAHINTRSAHVP
jgi:hypothetical protein